MQVISQCDIEKAIVILKDGGIGAVPTDTVYGLAACVFDTEAVGRVFDIKKRSGEKALPVLVDGWKNLQKVAKAEYIGLLKHLIENFWPGALTIVLPKQPLLPFAVSGGGETIAVRMPNNNVVLDIIREVGPITGTSANISGYGNCLTAEEVAQSLGEEVDFIIDGQSMGGMPSTIVDMTCYPPNILREGAICADEIVRLAL